MIKLIAFAAMITDHTCIFFYPQHELFMRSIGAISFPLFAYGICQGLKYTKDLQTYIISLVTCACITQPMFNLLFPHLHRLNDLYTLLFGLIVLVLYERHGPKSLYLAVLLILTNVVSLYIFIVFAVYFLEKRPVYLMGAITGFFILIWIISGSHYVLFGPLSVFLMYLNPPRLSLPGQLVRKYFFYAAYPGHFLIILLIMEATR